jgi:tetratricopeptide (TPR) repeat protein
MTGLTIHSSGRRWPSVLGSPPLSSNVRLKNMNENKLKELTNGTFGVVLWKNCFSVKLDGDNLIMSIPFKKVILPLSYIDKVTSEKTLKTTGAISYAMGGIYLKIDHHYARAPKIIHFFTEQSELWFETFKSRNIQIDTTQSANSESQGKEKIIASITGILAGIVALTALIVAIVALSNVNQENAGSLAKDNKASDIIDKGESYLENGKIDEAITEFTNLVQLHPNNAFAYSYLGNAYHNKGDYDNAIANYSKSIQLDPKDYQIYLVRGNAYLKKSNYDQAITDFSKYLKIEHRNGKAYYNRAVAYFYKKEYDKTWEDVHKAQIFGISIESNFLEDLKKASGRDK